MNYSHSKTYIFIISLSLCYYYWSLLMISKCIISKIPKLTVLTNLIIKMHSITEQPMNEAKIPTHILPMVMVNNFHHHIAILSLNHFLYRPKQGNICLYRAPHPRIKLYCLKTKPLRMDMTAMLRLIHSSNNFLVEVVYQLKNMSCHPINIKAKIIEMRH